jgi:hypothetical protein
VGLADVPDVEVAGAAVERHPPGVAETERAATPWTDRNLVT